MESVCNEFPVEWGQIDNYMQSVRDNNANSCDNSAKITNLLPSSHSEIHINCLYSESNQNHTDIQKFLLK